jgi:Zn-finger protein
MAFCFYFCAKARQFLKIIMEKEGSTFILQGSEDCRVIFSNHKKKKILTALSWSFIFVPLQGVGIAITCVL